jgi:predicted DNA-binding protein (MmcQ/YjbR family)
LNGSHCSEFYRFANPQVGRERQKKESGVKLEEKEAEMDFESLRTYLLSKPEAVEDFPFDMTTLVLKVGGKMFAALVINDQPLRVNLKCDPVKAELLREKYPAVKPGYHMNKKHWNTVVLDGSVPEDEIRAMVDESYALVVKGLPKKGRH